MTFGEWFTKPQEDDDGNTFCFQDDVYGRIITKARDIHYLLEDAYDAGFQAGKESLTEPVSSVIEQEHNGMEIVGD